MPTFTVVSGAPIVKIKAVIVVSVYFNEFVVLYKLGFWLLSLLVEYDNTDGMGFEHHTVHLPYEAYFGHIKYK